MLIAALCAEGTSTIGNIGADRPRLRADRRAPALARRADRARRGLVAGQVRPTRPAGSTRAWTSPAAARRGRSPGVPVLDHLLRRCSREYALVRPRARGRSGRRGGRGRGGRASARSSARRSRFGQKRRRGHGSAVVPADEALAHVAVEGLRPAARRSRTSTSATRASPASRATSSPRSCASSRRAPGLTLHVRLIEGSDPEHVLEAIFKALGVALAQS